MKKLLLILMFSLGLTGCGCGTQTASGVVMATGSTSVTLLDDKGVIRQYDFWVSPEIHQFVSTGERVTISYSNSMGSHYKELIAIKVDSNVIHNCNPAVQELRNAN